MIFQIRSLRLSFPSAKELRKRAELLPAGPTWKCTPWKPLYPTKTAVNLFHRDPIECIQSILSNPHVANHIHYTPLCVFKTAEKLIRVYSEWWTGHVAWDLQVR